MYIYYGLTPAGKTSNRLGSPEAKFIPKVNQGSRCTSKEKKTNVQRTMEAQITFRGAL